MKALPIPSGQNEGIGNAFKALPMPSGKDEGTANFPYQILLVKFHLQYRNVNGQPIRKSDSIPSFLVLE